MDDQVQQDYDSAVRFAVTFAAARTALWWSLCLATAVYVLLKLRVKSSTWPVFLGLLGSIASTGIRDSLVLSYNIFVKQTGRDNAPLYRALIFFNNFEGAVSLVVLLAIASGYCITRNNLGSHKPKVIVVPSVMLVTGLVTDFIYYNYVSSTNDYDLANMSGWESTLWFLGSFANVAALALAWMYIVDTLQVEMRALEAQHQALQPRKRTSNATSSTTRNGHSAEDEGGGSDSSHDHDEQYRLLEAGQSTADVEAPPQEQETVADRLSYQNMKWLMSCFAWGVSSYLLASILVVLLPIFVLDVVQNTISVLQFAVKYLFMAALLFVFRPQEYNPYLMVGASEADADDKGVSELATGIAMADLGLRENGFGEAVPMSVLPREPRASL